MTVSSSATRPGSRRSQPPGGRTRARPRAVRRRRTAPPAHATGRGRTRRRGFSLKYDRLLDRLLPSEAGARRRLDYYALRDLRLLGPVTPLALDDEVEIADSEAAAGKLVVHTTDFAPVVTQLAAADGVELNASQPSAKVNLDPPGVSETVRCAVALPVISEGGSHVSIRKQAADAMTSVDLMRWDALSADLVALLWLLYEHQGVVLFSGPTGVGKTTLVRSLVIGEETDLTEEVFALDRFESTSSEFEFRSIPSGDDDNGGNLRTDFSPLSKLAIRLSERNAVRRHA